MRIRRFKEDDLAEVISLHRETLLRENAYRGDGVWENDFHDINNIYIGNNGEFIVGVLNDRIIATGALKRIDDSTAEITSMRVHPDYQGKGYGREILQQLESCAESIGYRVLILETDEKLIAAMNLYERNGFIFQKREFIDGFDCLWYKKEI